MYKKILLPAFLLLLGLESCLPPTSPYPNRPPSEVVAEAEAWSKTLEQYIERWASGQAPAQIPSNLIPKGISDSKNFYLKEADKATAEETWAYRFAKPIDKKALLSGIPDPNVTYLFLGTCLAPFGSKMVVEGEFPHCRFFSVQISPPLNGVEYYAQRVFGTAEVSIADADIEPLPGNVNPFRPGANRNAINRKYRLEFDLKTGNPTALNEGAHDYPHRKNSNRRTAAMLTYQGPLGYKTVAGTDLAVQGDWNLGAFWIRIYQPDSGTGALGGVPMPKVWFELPNGKKYFIGSDFSALQDRADRSIANRSTDPKPTPDSGPTVGWFKSWGITRSMLNGVCLANNWSRRDSGARAAAVDLGWTGRGEFQPAPGNIEPHATTNNYASYLGRSMTVAPGMVAVLTGKMPTFPHTRNGEGTMGTGQVRYWSICGIDQDPLSPLPATTIHAISDDEVALDANRNYVIVYSNSADRPANATKDNGVNWIDWGTQTSHGLLMRWVCVAPEWNFPLSPHEKHLDWAHSDWSGSKYDSTLLGVNWRNGFMQCYLPKVHYLAKAEFEALGSELTAEKIPVWVEDGYKTGASEARLGTINTSSVLDTTSANAAKNINDGDYNTGWSSQFGQQNAQVTVDLGKKKVISAVKLFWDLIFFAKNYDLQVSDDQQNWTTIATVSKTDGKIDLFKNLQNVRARYVRLDLKAYNVGWYRLGEFEVFTNDCDCAPPTTRLNTPPVGKIKLRVFPNPTSDFLWFDLEDAVATTIQIFDAANQRQHAVSVESNKIDLRNLPTGAYFLRIGNTSGRFATAKFVIIR